MKNSQANPQRFIRTPRKGDKVKVYVKEDRKPELCEVAYGIVKRVEVVQMTSTGTWYENVVLYPISEVPALSEIRYFLPANRVRFL